MDATHIWLVDGVATAVIADGGEIYDKAHEWARAEGRPGVAQYEVTDYDADGGEVTVVRLPDGRLAGILRPLT